MPYAVTFTKPITAPGAEPYINNCCIGGDLVLAQLLPRLRERYGPDLEAVQEDWGWFVWFDHDGVKLAIDVFTHDPERGEFEMHLTSRQPRLLRPSRVTDTPALEALREEVVAGLQRWPVDRLTVERLDEKHMPIA